MLLKKWKRTKMGKNKSFTEQRNMVQIETEQKGNYNRITEFTVNRKVYKR